jgi:hypothetical protein
LCVLRLPPVPKRRLTLRTRTNSQAGRWLETVANVRVHRTTSQRPIARFELEERSFLGPLAKRLDSSLVLGPPKEPRAKLGPVVPEVERRPLRVYARLAGGVR